MPELESSSLYLDSFMGLHTKYTSYSNVNMGNESKSSLSKCGDSSVVATCHLCNKEFKSLWGFKCHKKIHAISLGQPDECFKCFVCGKFCQSVSHLRRHMRCHSEDKPFKCEKCGKSYKHNNGLKVHQCRVSNVIEPPWKLPEDFKEQGFTDPKF